MQGEEYVTDQGLLGVLHVVGVEGGSGVERDCDVTGELGEQVEIIGHVSGVAAPHARAHGSVRLREDTPNFKNPLRLSFTYSGMHTLLYTAFVLRTLWRGGLIFYNCS